MWFKHSPRLNVCREKGRSLKLCGSCNSKKECQMLKSILVGSKVYGSKISKIAEDTELSKEQVENTLRRLLSSGLVSRDKTRKPTRWFPDWYLKVTVFLQIVFLLDFFVPEELHNFLFFSASLPGQLTVPF